MECIALAIENKNANLLKKTRLKVSEWLDFENIKSNITITVYLKCFSSEKIQELKYLFLVVSKKDFEHIILPTKDEIDEENEILQKEKLSQMINIGGEYIQPISVEDICKKKETKEYVLIRIKLKESKIDCTKMTRFQFKFYVQDSFRRNSWLSTFFGSSWDWNYEAPIYPLIVDKNGFDEIVPIKIDLELWLMIEPTMFDSISDLNIRSTLSYDRLIILPAKIAKYYGKTQGILCIRWFFPEFSESALGAKIEVVGKKSTMEREKNYVDEINSEPDRFFSVVNQILNDCRIACVDFKYIAERLEKKELSKFLDFLFQLLYHRDDPALSQLKDFVDILEELQELKYGRYYFHLYRLLYQMRTCTDIRDIISPAIKNRIEEFLNKSVFINKAVRDLFEKLKNLITLIDNFYYNNLLDEKKNQKKEIMEKIKELKEMCGQRLINPESYLMNKEILTKWEQLIEDEFKQFVGSPKINVKLKTKRLLKSDHIYLIFDITNISDVPLVILEAELLPSEQYEIVEYEKIETTKRKRLTKSDPNNERIFTPEFVVHPKELPEVHIKLKVKAFTEEGKRFSDIFDMRLRLFEADTTFKKVEENPYIVGKPVKRGEMFYGWEKIRQKIIKDKSIEQLILYGQFRTGKTSVLLQLMNELKREYIPVLAISHQFETGDSELLRFWSKQIALAVQDRKWKVPEIPDYEKASNPYREFRDFFNEIIGRSEGNKIIFMIDEYDIIDELFQNEKLSEGIFQLLDWMVKHDKIDLILAGRSSINTLKTENWKNNARRFASIKLGPLERDDAIKLMKEPVKDYIEYDDSAIEKILMLTNGYPYLIQLCCFVLVEYHNSKKKNVIIYADVEKTISDVIEIGSPVLMAIVLKDTTEEEQIVLRVMADFLREHPDISEEELVLRMRKYNPEIKDGDIKQVLSNLKEKEIIRSVEEEVERFKFVCELYKYLIFEKMEQI